MRGLRRSREKYSFSLSIFLRQQYPDERLLPNTLLMETIKELIGVIERNKVKEVEVIGYPHGEKETMLNAFYGKLVSGELETDEQAAAFFFKTDPSDIAYRKLKSKLKTRLLNSVFFMNIKQSNYTELDRAYITCWKEWAAVKILFNRGASRAAADLSLRILKQSALFEFTELSLNICKTLRSLYATSLPDSKKFAYFNQQTKVLSRQWEAEMRAEEFYFLLVSNYIHSRAAQPAVAQQAEAYIREMEPDLQEKPTYRLQRYYYQIKTISYLCRNEYRNAIRVCEEALEVFGRKAFSAPSNITFFHFQIIACCTYLKEYDKGYQIANINLEQERPGSYNWFKNRELSFILAMHTKKYQEAYEIYLQVVHHPAYRQLDALNMEYWKIFEAYVMYLKTIGKIETSPEEYGAGFRVGKFINEVPIFSRDKQGMNIPILIIQILFIIANRRYELAIERMEAVAKYCTRYLRKDDTYRSNLFIRMLLAIPQAGFHQQAVVRNVSRLLDKLKHMPLEIAQKGTQFEVIPYEDLWEMAVDSLHAKIYVAHRRKPVAMARMAVREPEPVAARNRKKE